MNLLNQMDDNIKVNFIKPMLVLKIREAYKAPYHKNKYLRVSKEHCKSVATFKKFMHQFTGNWSSGPYDVQFVIKEGGFMNQLSYSTLVRVDILDGKVDKMVKDSPYSKKPYPIWKFISEARKKAKELREKEAKKKKTVKKKVTKKVVKKKK
ncbi:hypothetical protein HON86_00470 [Candidatus Woesearchaeota archaeon]|jgi:hypothetical protein|nr:hypothetical protein [Candidatus Woesearchaeota archaeon]MBT7169520.1 hypothetical protein [Candidatus Woesearchaeota archaeon]